MSIVVCELPKAGLGNQLFALVKATVFAELNGLPLYVKGYNQFKIGPWLRGEKIKRNYYGYFTFEKGLLGQQLDRLSLSGKKGLERVAEPNLTTLSINAREGKQFVFAAIPHWSDYFAGLKDHRDLAITLLRRLIRERITRTAEQLEAPCIGVHIRMGDFRKLRAGEDFRKVGAVRTPEDYFVSLIQRVRELSGRELPVSVFTDGYRHEFQRLFDMENVSMVEGNADIVDLLLLSRSKLIITSAGSTFSYWSAFLANSPVIMHPDHLHASVRPIEVNRHWYEGPLDPAGPDKLLAENIQGI